jgi:cellulose synthase/poly-beta-1,6-N-acetylglucosamine synthase-like glycosyltransferase
VLLLLLLLLLLLQARYLNEYLVKGEAPTDPRGVFKQRSRWCKGQIQVSASTHWASVTGPVCDDPMVVNKHLEGRILTSAPSHSPLNGTLHSTLCLVWRTTGSLSAQACPLDH